MPDLFWLTRYEWIDNGRVMDLTDALNTPAYCQTSGTWRETFFEHPGPIQYKQRFWTVPWDLYTDGYIWYIVDLFTQHGKQPPSTWNELLALRESFKSQDIASFSQSNDPLYSNQWFRLLAQRIAGLDKIRATASATREEGNHCTDPEFLQAAQMAQDVAKNGFFLFDYEGMNYQTAQIEFNQGHAANMLIGNWLAGEMAASRPDEFNAENVGFPAVEGGAGDATVQDVIQAGELEYHAGRLKVPMRPGVGVTLDRERLAEHHAYDQTHGEFWPYQLNGGRVMSSA